MYDPKFCKVNTESRQSAYSADLGLIHPVVYQEGEIKIQPFFDCAENIQETTINIFVEEWKNEMTPQEARQYIFQNWGSSDILFVLTKGQCVLGFVSVDRRNFYPCTSHLVVNKGHRGNGYSKYLVGHAEAYTQECLGFKENTLWCNQDLIGYYTKLGYTQHKDTRKDASDVIVMKKKLTS